MALLGSGLGLALDPLFAYGFGQAAATALGLALLLGWLRRKQLLRFQRVSVRAIVTRTWPFWLSGLTGQARSLDTTIITLSAGPYAAGLYGAASRLMNPFLLASGSMSSVLLPHATRSSEALQRKTLGWDTPAAQFRDLLINT